MENPSSLFRPHRLNENEMVEVSVVITFRGGFFPKIQINADGRDKANVLLVGSMSYFPITHSPLAGSLLDPLTGRALTLSGARRRLSLSTGGVLFELCIRGAFSFVFISFHRHGPTHHWKSSIDI